MKFVVLPPVGGKTTALLDALRDGDVDVLFFPNEHQKRSAYEMARRRGDKVAQYQFISVGRLPEALQALQGRLRTPRVGIDEIENVLNVLFAFPVEIKMIAGSER